MLAKAGQPPRMPYLDRIIPSAKPSILEWQVSIWIGPRRGLAPRGKPPPT